MTLVETFLPLFALIALGFVAVRSGYLDAAAVPPMGAVVMRLALPALIFLAIATVPAAQALDGGFLLAYAAGSLVTMAACMAVARFALGLDGPVVAVIGLGVSMANSGFMGFPIAQALIGPEAATLLLAHCMAVENVLILPLALLLIGLSGTGTERPRIGALLIGMARNPLLIALLAGLALTLTGLHLPSLAQMPLELLARLSAPLALLVIGGMMATLPVQARAGVVALLVAGKLVLHPLAVWSATGLIPGTGAVLPAGGVLFAAMPMITIFPLLGARAGHGQLSACGLLVATLCSFASLPVAVFVLGLV